nr:hypothetical protein CFP56_16768 [Quercus suber]
MSDVTVGSLVTLAPPELRPVPLPTQLRGGKKDSATKTPHPRLGTLQLIVTIRSCGCRPRKHDPLSLLATFCPHDKARTACRASLFPARNRSCRADRRIEKRQWSESIESRLPKLQVDVRLDDPVTEKLLHDIPSISGLVGACHFEPTAPMPLAH